MDLLNDNSILPYGKYKGRALKHTPAYWLLFIRDQFVKNGISEPYKEFNHGLKNYIEDNFDVLNKEVGQGRGYKR